MCPRCSDARRPDGLKERQWRERGGHALDEIDVVLPSPPLQGVPVGRPPFLVMTYGLTEDTTLQTRPGEMGITLPRPRGITRLDPVG